MCDCIKHINESLQAQFGETARLDLTQTTADGRVTLTAAFLPKKADGNYYKHNRYLGVRPAFCPFCGEPYEPDNAVTRIVNPY